MNSELLANSLEKLTVQFFIFPDATCCSQEMAISCCTCVKYHKINDHTSGCTWSILSHGLYYHMVYIVTWSILSWSILSIIFKIYEHFYH